jgi:hypothetical protein
MEIFLHLSFISYSYDIVGGETWGKETTGETQA